MTKLKELISKIDVDNISEEFESELETLVEKYNPPKEIIPEEFYCPHCNLSKTFLPEALFYHIKNKHPKEFPEKFKGNPRQHLRIEFGIEQGKIGNRIRIIQKEQEHLKELWEEIFKSIGTLHGLPSFLMYDNLQIKYQEFFNENSWMTLEKSEIEDLYNLFYNDLETYREMKEKSELIEKVYQYFQINHVLSKNMRYKQCAENYKTAYWEHFKTDLKEPTKDILIKFTKDELKSIVWMIGKDK